MRRGRRYALISASATATNCSTSAVGLETLKVRVHPGRDWFYVLEGTLRLRLGSREVLVNAAQAASFDTMTPHSMGGHGGPAEILSILDHHGERAHLHN
jgi:uncharacterized cupin superfamily protein